MNETTLTAFRTKLEKIRFTMIGEVKKKYKTGKNSPNEQVADIADEAAENAKEDIGKTAEEQKDLANQLDPKGHLADTAREIAREDIPPIEDKAKLGKADAQNQLDQAKKALEEAAAKADQAGKDPENNDSNR